MILVDLTGQRFGRLTVAERAENSPRGHARWHARCDCGGSVTTQGYNLRGGHTTSCGCVKLERCGESGRATRRHGHAKPRTPEYRSWESMRERCTNPRHCAWRNYGGRGIVICDRWRSFTAFLADMGPRPSSLHSLDRIDNNGNYEPGNCRWATSAQQRRNSRQNRVLAFNGERLILADWAVRIGITVSALSNRLLKWPLDRALTEGNHRC